MSYFTQMAGLAYHNFVSAAAGIAVAIAFIRGIAQKETGHASATSGSTWCARRCGCCCRSAVVGALFLVSQGVVQNFKPYDTCVSTTARGRADAERSRRGRWRRRRSSSSSAPTAAASSTPTARIRSRTRRRSPTSSRCSASSRSRPGLTYTLGTMTGSRRHGWAVWAAMAFLFLAGVTRRLLGRGARQSAADRGRRRSDGRRRRSPGGNMEGKEVRFGIANSALFATVTTDASCGAVNGWHDSFTPLGGLVPLVNISSARWSSAASAPGCTACWSTSSCRSSSPG